MDGSMQMEAAPRACPQPGRWKGRAALAGAALAFVLGAAHFFRSGQHGLACVCLVWAGLLWRPVAWLRRSAAVFLLGLAAEWGMTTLALARWRLQLGQDWLRMVCILGAVAALTLLAAAALRSRACRRGEVSGPRAQALACLLVSALLLLLDGLRPDLLLLHRLVPGWGAGQALLAGLASGPRMAAAHLAAVFLRVFRAAAGGAFPAQPVPFAGRAASARAGTHPVRPAVPGRGLALHARAVRGLAAAGGQCLVQPSVLSGRLAADAGPRSGRGVPALWRKMRWGLRAVSLLLPLGLRLAGLPWPWALVFALALGLALLPCALWLSRKLGIPVYCCGICPLGMTANLLARLSPWRLRRNGHCTGCGACARVCRYGALRLDGDGRVAGPGWRCTLCRDCMSVCRHRALEIRCCGQGGAWVEQALLCSLSVLHTLFLFMGRV